MNKELLGRVKSLLGRRSGGASVALLGELIGFTVTLAAAIWLLLKAGHL